MLQNSTTTITDEEVLGFCVKSCFAVRGYRDPADIVKEANRLAPVFRSCYDNMTTRLAGREQTEIKAVFMPIMGKTVDRVEKIRYKVADIVCAERVDDDAEEQELLKDTLSSIKRASSFHFIIDADGKQMISFRYGSGKKNKTNIYLKDSINQATCMRTFDVLYGAMAKSVSRELVSEFEWPVNFYPQVFRNTELIIKADHELFSLIKETLTTDLQRFIIPRFDKRNFRKEALEICNELYSYLMHNEELLDPTTKNKDAAIELIDKLLGIPEYTSMPEDIKKRYLNEKPIVDKYFDII